MSPTLLRLSFIGLTALALVATSVSPLQGKPVDVDCNSPKTNLQKILDNAAVGATVRLAGTCDDGPYFIRKDLNLQGSTGATLSAPANSDFILSLRGVAVQLTELTINANHAGNAILIEGASLEATRVVVQGASGSGLRIDGSSFAIVTDSEFSDNGESGVLVIWASNAFLFQNRIHDNEVGVIVVNNGSASGGENEIKNNHIGVLVSKMSSAGISDNLIEDNSDKGVWIANQYGYVEAGVNTIQNNGTDVVCDARGIFESPAAQTSSTSTTSVSPECTVLGTIF